MAREVLAALVLLAAGLAGCMGDDAGDRAAPATAQDAETQAADATANGSAEAREDAVEPRVEDPGWSVGDWWRYDVSHRLGPDASATLVVTDVRPGAYTLAWADADEALETLVYHMPPAGEVSRPNLAWWVHGEQAGLLELPLEDGDTWTGTFSGTDFAFQADVAVEDGAPVATVEAQAEDENQTLTATFDAEVGFFTEMTRRFEPDQEPSPAVTLAEHGSIDDAPTDGLQVPEPADLVHHVALGPDPATGRPPIGDPAGTFTVENGTDRLALAAFMGAGPGVYQVAWQPPDGGPTVTVDENQPGDDSFSTTIRTVEPAEGTWAWDTLAGGPGVVVFEAVGVPLEDANLDS